MVETKRHGDAFDYYYSLGNSRSYMQVAQKLHVSKTSVAKWSKAFNWNERVIQRDLEINKKTEEKTNDAIVNTKADYRADIRLALQPIKALINSAIIEKENPKTGKKESVIKFSVEDPKDMASMITSLEKLIKADLLLMGEADSHAQLSGSAISFNFGNKLTEDDI